MQKLVTGMTTNRGFTLIEILIVIVIIGITVGFALIAFGDFGESKRILFAADQLGNTLKLAQQQAILEHGTLGLKIDNSSYQILKLHNASEWKPISNKGVFKVHYFPHNTVITLKTNNKASAGAPSIVIGPSGDLTPFTLDFGINKNNTIVTLTGSANGTLNFVTATTK